MSHDVKPPPSGAPGQGRQLTCEECLAIVYEYLDGELDAGSHGQVRQHLEKCRKCYPYFNFERLFLDYVHQVGKAGRGSADLERRVRALLEEEPG